MATTKKQDETIIIPRLKQHSLRLRIIGVRPLYQNRTSEKVRHELLVGGKRKTAAERQEIKHRPFDEYRNSAERVDSGPTALGIRTVAVKAAMCSAAVDTAGVTRAGMQRLLWVPGDHYPVYGTPKLKMDVTRSADMNRTPDIRTRCFLPQWCAEIELLFISPQLSAQSVATLLANAGVLIGIGDFRQEKGKGNFGCFRVIGADEQDDEWDWLVANGGREAQLNALESPQYACSETAELMAFYQGEVKRRAA